jgi:glucose-6-phosphate-specific signal transduction histidine kinase
VPTTRKRIKRRPGVIGDLRAFTHPALISAAFNLANAEKHARASVVKVSAEASDGRLRVRVRDDGIGGADPVRGSGLLGLKDRIEARGGTFSVHSPVGRARR